jgi:hypothetical protein
MKTCNLKKLSAICSFVLIAAGFSSCSKDSVDASLTGTASLMIVNGAEGSAPQDFYSDNTKVNSSAVVYTQSSGYVSTAAGNHQGQFRTSGTTTVNSSSNITLQSGKYYTVYLGGSGSSSSTVTTTDDMTAPSSGKARVRFVHLSSAAASSIDLAITGGAKIVSGLAYQSASAYNEVDPTSAFTLSAAGSTTAALSIPAFMQAGKIYTVFISGATTATVSFHVVAQN